MSARPFAECNFALEVFTQPELFSAELAARAPSVYERSVVASIIAREAHQYIGHVQVRGTHRWFALLLCSFLHSRDCHAAVLVHVVQLSRSQGERRAALVVRAQLCFARTLACTSSADGWKGSPRAYDGVPPHLWRGRHLERGVGGEGGV